LANKDVDILFSLYEIYDRNRDSMLWFLEDFNVKSYEEYKQKYHGTFQERCNFIGVVGFFEFFGIL